MDLLTVKVLAVEQPGVLLRMTCATEYAEDHYYVVFYCARCAASIAPTTDLPDFDFALAGDSEQRCVFSGIDPDCAHWLGGVPWTF